MHEPDKWIIIKLTNNEEIIYKVLGGFHGGYLSGESWRLNSGIAKVIEEDSFFIFIGYSGSSYKCMKGSYGTTFMSGMVLSDMLTQHKDNIEVLSDKFDFNKLLGE